MPPPTLVLDASATLAWAFEDEENGYPDFVLESLVEAQACVQIIWPLEVAMPCWPPSDAATMQFLAILWQLPIVVEPERPERVLGEILSLARARAVHL